MHEILPDFELIFFSEQESFPTNEFICRLSYDEKVLRF